MIRLEAISRRPFHVAVCDAMDAIAGCGGWIKSHHVYSNMLAVIAFEAPAAQMAPLAAALGEAGIVVDAPPPPAAGEADVAGHLSISFLAQGPDVRRTVPAVG